jgi:hypothetical protein
MTLAITVAACSGQPAGTGGVGGATGGPTTGPSESATPGATIQPGGATSAPSGGGPQLTQPWATATLTDVRTGASVRIADLVASGMTVFVEPMAVWCTKCRAQQERAVEAFRSVDRNGAAWIGLDVETAETAEQLAQYADARGFDFTYVVADREMLRALVEEFGEVVVNPPSTNIIVVGRDGAVRHVTGGLTVEEIIAATAPSPA